MDAAAVRLTRREQELLPLLARGLCNRGIAEQLSSGTRTVEMHIAKLLRKSMLGNRARIAAWSRSKVSPKYTQNDDKSRRNCDLTGPPNVTNNAI